MLPTTFVFSLKASTSRPTGQPHSQHPSSKIIPSLPVETSSSYLRCPFNKLISLNYHPAKSASQHLLSCLVLSATASKSHNINLPFHSGIYHSVTNHLCSHGIHPNLPLFITSSPLFYWLSCTQIISHQTFSFEDFCNS